MKQDKITHALAGACVAAAAFPIAPLLALFAVPSVAITRELWNETGFDWLDVLATVVGGVWMLLWLLLVS